MATQINDALNIDLEEFESTGAYNGFVDLDSQFYIDPHLLKNASTPELKSSHKKFKSYFKDVIKLVNASDHIGDPFSRKAIRLLTFKEIPNLGLGYSRNGIHGSAIGRKLAVNLYQTASEIVDKGIKDPELFELVGLLEEGVGADRISDMTCRIIIQDLLTYTQRVTKILSIKNTSKLYYKDSCFVVPKYKEHIILIPKEILSPLPIAYNWDDIDFICNENEELRNKVNKIIGNTWKKATNRNRISKKDLREILIEHPELLEDLIKQYREKTPKHYDFKNDPVGEFIWHHFSQKFAKEYPLDLRQYSKTTDKKAIEVVKLICKHFRELIENNGLNILLYDDSKKRRHERYAQRLFYGIADAYCRANDLDLNAEPNAGRGPVDFKLSRGYNLKINVEVKYSDNSNLIKGYTTQLPIYNESEKSTNSIYLVIRTKESTTNIDNLLELREEDLKSGMRVPDIIVVDGRVQDSASKA